jgi:hypothetical protein
MKLLYLKSELKFNSFDVSIGIKILFFRVSIAIEPGHSLLTVRYHELFDNETKVEMTRALSVDEGRQIVKYCLFRPTF